MIVTFFHQGNTPLEIWLEKIPELGDEITVDGKRAWIISIGRQIVGVDLEHQWQGQYTFDREKYFR